MTAKPRFVAAAVDQLLRNLTAEERREIAALAEDDLIDLHFGLGQRIRNEFGLWGENEALLSDCRRLRASNPPVDAAPTGYIHADDASALIIRTLWSRLRH